MHKKLSFIAIMLFSFAISACSNSKNEVSVTSASISSSSIIEKEVSISVSASSASASTTVSSVSEEDDDPGIEAKPVEDEEDTLPSINEAFLDDYDTIEGNYTDEKNNEITLSIESFGCEAQLLISYPKENHIKYEWEMTATIKDGKLEYSNCSCMKINNTDPDAPDYEVEYLDGKGYFEIKENKLIWTGAEDDSCKSLSFVKK